MERDAKQRLKQRLKKIADFQAAAGGICLAAALALLALRLGTKYIGEHEPAWAGEMAMYVFVWGIFLESGALVYEKRHFAFEALAEGIKNRRAKQLIVLFDSLVKLAFSLMAVYYGCRLAGRLLAGGETYGLSRGFLWLCLPFCGMTSVLYLLFHLWEDWAEKRDADSEEPVKEEGEKC